MTRMRVASGHSSTGGIHRSTGLAIESNGALALGPLQLIPIYLTPWPLQHTGQEWTWAMTLEDMEEGTIMIMNLRVRPNPFPWLYHLKCLD